MKIIEAINLTKKFGDFTANDNINIAIEKGEITAICGENGAGKTTLMNMFYGLSKPTSGELKIAGETVSFKSPDDAINKGIGMVHQHFKLIPSLTVYENILLGAEITKGILLNTKAEINAVKKLIAEYKFELDANDKIDDISIGAKQRVEILKMLYRNVDILIFDEPTAVLTPQEVDELLDSFIELKNQGKTIILITHKLREVMKVSDQVVVIKHGKVIGTKRTLETSAEEIATMMVGRPVMLNVQKTDKDFKDSEVLYKVENLNATDDNGKQVLENINLEIKKGEILGVAGVEGNGQSELVKILTGLMCSKSGKTTIAGENITNLWPDELRKKKIAFVPEDRYIHGLCRDMSISDNMIAGYQSKKSYCKNGILVKKEIENKCDELVQNFDIRLAERHGNVSQLSGGNAQKIIIAREIDADPDVMIISQPTRGVDIGSIEFIYKKLLKLRDEGKAILLVSSELSEIMSLSDKIAVMYKGKIVDEVEAKGITSSELGLLMAGIKKEGGEK